MIAFQEVIAVAKSGTVQELADLRERVEHLEEAVEALLRTGTSAPKDGFRWPGEVDKEKIRPVVLAAMRAMGLSTDPPTVTPQEIREQMIREGVRPEERLGNSILEEMRGYKD